MSNPVTPGTYLRPSPQLRGGKSVAASLISARIAPAGTGAGSLGIVTDCCRANGKPAGEVISLVSKNPLRPGAGVRARIALLNQETEQHGSFAAVRPQ